MKRCEGCGQLQDPAVMFVNEDHLPIRANGCLAPTYEQLVDETVMQDKSFELRRNADMRAIERWRAEDPHGRRLILPDHADLCVWLLKSRGLNGEPFTLQGNIDHVWAAVAAANDGTIHNAFAELLGDARHIKAERDELLVERTKLQEHIRALEQKG